VITEAERQMRFTMRDLMRLTIVVALAMGWSINRADWSWRMNAVRWHAMSLHDSLLNAHQNQYAEDEAALKPVDRELAGKDNP
jgi:hypothetical protein